LYKYVGRKEGRGREGGRRDGDGRRAEVRRSRESEDQWGKFRLKWGGKRGRSKYEEFFFLIFC
jgi:hypothetical protein